MGLMIVANPALKPRQPEFGRSPPLVLRRWRDQQAV